MKELAVIATLIALGYGTESSLVYVLDESCRVYEKSSNETRFNQHDIVVAVIPMNSTWGRLPATRPLVPLESQAGSLRHMNRASESSSPLEKSSTSQVALLTPDVK